MKQDDRADKYGWLEPGDLVFGSPDEPISAERREELEAELAGGFIPIAQTVAEATYINKRAEKLGLR